MGYECCNCILVSDWLLYSCMCVNILVSTSARVWDACWRHQSAVCYFCAKCAPKLTNFARAPPGLGPAETEKGLPKTLAPKLATYLSPYYTKAQQLSLCATMRVKQQHNVAVEMHHCHKRIISASQVTTIITSSFWLLKFARCYPFCTSPTAILTSKTKYKLLAYKITIKLLGRVLVTLLIAKIYEIASLVQAKTLYETKCAR